MTLEKQKIEGLRAIKIVVKKDEEELGSVYLYLINNDLHKEPYGLMEDINVKEENRGQGIGTQLLEAVIEEAKAQGCYKLIAQSRYERCSVHDWYKKYNFRDHGKNFRMDFK